MPRSQILFFCKSPKTKVQSPKSKVQSPKSKVQSPKPKAQRLIMVGNTKRKMRDDTPRWQPQSSEGAITSLLNQALVDGAAREALVNLTTLITSSRANAAKAARYKEKAIKLNRRLTEKRFQVSLLKGELEKKEGLGMDQIKQVIIPYENVQQQRQQQEELAAKVRLMSARIVKLEEENFKLRRNSKRVRSEL